MSAFFPFPAWLVRRSDVSWPAKVLFAVLVRYTRRGTREAFPSIETLATDMASPRRSVERWLAELEHAGLVGRERTGRACTFHLTADPGPMPATDGGSEGHVGSATDGGSRSATSGSGSATPGASDTPPLAYQPPLSPISGGVEILREGERARPDPRDTLASAWRVGFVRRFERIAGGTHGGPAGAHMAALIDAALAQRDPAAFIERALDGFFGTPRHITSRPAFPVKYLAEDPVGYAATATTPSGATSARNSELVSEIPRAEVP